MWLLFASLLLLVVTVCAAAFLLILRRAHSEALARIQFQSELNSEAHRENEQLAAQIHSLTARLKTALDERDEAKAWVHQLVNELKEKYGKGETLQ